jgi:hypothetical protein
MCRVPSSAKPISFVERRIYSGVISVLGVTITCSEQRNHQCGGLTGFARILEGALGVTARSRGRRVFIDFPFKPGKLSVNEAALFCEQFVDNSSLICQPRRMTGGARRRAICLSC